jgi:hypothetical protein
MGNFVVSCAKIRLMAMHGWRWPTSSVASRWSLHRLAIAMRQRGRNDRPERAINDGLAAIAARGQVPGMPQCFASAFR